MCDCRPLLFPTTPQGSTNLGLVGEQLASQRGSALRRRVPTEEQDRARGDAPRRGGAGAEIQAVAARYWRPKQRQRKLPLNRLLLLCLGISLFTCSRGLAHGPNWYVFLWQGGETRSKYIGKTLPQSG
jgi:hypothetical protein